MKLAPGAIGHCVTDGVPSYHGVTDCRSLCQCNDVPSSGPVMWLCIVTWIVSPQFASIAGPAGNSPLMRITRFSEEC